MKLKVAVFPGSFDPITLGHIDIIYRALKLFDKVIIAIGMNTEKNYMFTLQKRKELITSIFKNDNKIKIQDYSGLTVNLCKKHQSNYIVRGLRNHSDFSYEKDIALTNNKLNNGIETIFFLTSQEHMMISSSIVKEIIKHKGDLKPFLHPNTISNIE